MSRFVKKQLFSMVDLLDKANKTLEKNLLKKKQNENGKLLQKPQQNEFRELLVKVLRWTEVKGQLIVVQV